MIYSVQFDEQGRVTVTSYDQATGGRLTRYLRPGERLEVDAMTGAVHGRIIEHNYVQDFGTQAAQA